MICIIYKDGKLLEEFFYPTDEEDDYEDDDTSVKEILGESEPLAILLKLEIAEILGFIGKQ